MRVAHDTPTDPASFNKDSKCCLARYQRPSTANVQEMLTATDAFHGLEISREGDRKDSNHKVVQESTRQPSTNNSTYTTRPATATSTAAATCGDSRSARRPTVNTGRTLPVRPAAITIQPNVRTTTQQQAADYIRARMAQRQVSAALEKQVEEEDESSTEESDSDDEDEDDTE